MSRVSGAASRCSGPSRILAKTRSNGARARIAGAATPSAFMISTKPPARLSRALARATRTALGIDVGRQHAPTQCAGGGDGEHARAGAEIENAPSSAADQRLAQPVERQQAAARGAVMAGAEGQRRLDLDADAIERHAGAIMGAVHDEAPGRDRRQSGEAFAAPNPWPRCARSSSALPAARARPRAATSARTAISVGRGAKIDHDPPAARRRLLRLTAISSASKALGNEIGDPPCRLFIGFQHGKRRRRRFVVFETHRISWGCCLFHLIHKAKARNSLPRAKIK